MSIQQERPILPNAIWWLRDFTNDNLCLAPIFQKFTLLLVTCQAHTCVSLPSKPQDHTFYPSNHKTQASPMNTHGLRPRSDKSCLFAMGEDFLFLRNLLCWVSWCWCYNLWQNVPALWLGSQWKTPLHVEDLGKKLLPCRWSWSSWLGFCICFIPISCIVMT